MRTLPAWGIGVPERRGDEGMRGDVWVRRTAGREVRELMGKPSGGVATEEDTEDEPELVSVARTRAIGLAVDITGERGVLVPWIWSQQSLQTRHSRTWEIGESYTVMGTCLGGWRNGSLEASRRVVVLLEQSAQKTPPHFLQC